MKKIVVLLLTVLILTNRLFGQYNEEPVALVTPSGEIKGALLCPSSSGKIPVVLIIAGSGPTDRNGNNSMMQNNSLKMLAEGLYENGIASLRYDKRGIGESKNAMISESALRFENYINDVKGWCDLLSRDNRFSELIILGHSEGSLIGMIASQKKQVNKFISLAGAGQPAGDAIREQLKAQPSEIYEQSLPIIAKLENGETVDSIPPMLRALFRSSVQPYMISWFKYNPQTEISKLTCPVLIIQGTTDIQVTIQDAEKLHKSNNASKMIIIEKMNHILKESVLDRAKNIETYNNPDLPLKKELITEIVNFILEK